jgi:hypothetical protein
MANNRLVWFLLVDREGHPFRGTTASSVDIPSSYVIDQFRRAVKTQCDQEGDDLKRILASKLLVYANKAAFDANTVDVPTNLRSSHSLEEGGGEKMKMLVLEQMKIMLWWLWFQSKMI